MKKVLLHSCCAPCSSAIIEWMMNNGITPVVYYCNPNIYPEEEYYIRKNEITKYVKELGLQIIDDDSNENWKGWNCYHNSWLKEIEGMESEPERGLRCLKCFKVRLLHAAEVAVREGIDSFTTTLASSRWKSIEQINEAGQWAAETVNARFSSPRISFDGRSSVATNCSNRMASTTNSIAVVNSALDRKARIQKTFCNKHLTSVDKIIRSIRSIRGHLIF